ncbi:MAG: hypothetical protein E7415_06320 [Ruminococcaceae bacterium]|nr:hypothetical protein [Oscillospiraceae bacterium]
MNKTVVRAIALIIAVALIFGVIALGVSSVFAANEQEQIDASNERIQKENEKKKELEQEKALTAENIEALKKETVEIQAKIDAKNEEIRKINEELEKAQKDLEAAKERSEKQYAAYRERFRVMCEDGSVSYISVILSSKNLMDFVNNVEIAQEISEYDKKIHDEMKAAEEKIEELRKKIQESKETLEKEKEVLDGQQAALLAKQSELEEIKRKLQSDMDAAQKIIDEEYRKQEELKRQMAKKLSKEGDGTTFSGAFRWPTPSCTYITSHFAPQRVNPVTGVLRPHTGTDIGAQYGAQIIAAASGTVKFAAWNGGYGNCVIIDHGGGVSTLYAHMSSISVSAGQYIEAGGQVGKVGSTGNSTGPHLHFEVIINGVAVNPMQYF